MLHHIPYINCYVYIMSNMTRDKFYFGYALDLRARMIEFQDKIFRRENIPNGKRQCHFLVFYQYFEHPMPAIDLRRRIALMDTLELKKFIRHHNPKWMHLNDEVLKPKKEVEAPLNNEYY